MKRFLFSLFFGIIFNVQPAFSYYVAFDHPENLRIDHTISESPIQDNFIYVVYGNEVSDDEDTYLSFPKPGFLSIDSIKIDMPLKLLMHNLIQPDATIDRMLAANLRIRKIVQEYRELQNRAKTFLSTTSSYSRKSKYNSNASEPKVIRSKVKTKSSKAKSTGSKIGSLRPKVRSQHTKPKSTVVDFKAEKVRINKIYSSIERLEVNSSLTGSSENIVIPDINTAISENSQNDGVINNTSTYSENTTQQVDVRFEDTLFQLQKKRTRSNEPIDLPWFFKVPLKIWSLLIIYRVEVALAVIFIFLVVFVISLKAGK